MMCHNIKTEAKGFTKLFGNIEFCTDSSECIDGQG